MALTKQDYERNWPAVQTEVDALSAQGKWEARNKVIRQAIAATSNPAGKDPEDLEIIANWHDQLVGECECPACMEHARRTGALY